MLVGFMNEIQDRKVSQWFSIQQELSSVAEVTKAWIERIRGYKVQQKKDKRERAEGRKRKTTTS